ncbi:MAG: nickel pincer cofactor biosynthesis protein LarC [Armatimonadetes bacterium]|jgi:uncharacterized protein (TIGR00299 family) protein|nr:nickel pincer cofactor biosynthesis protein LarC [Armatimonadota bacterium]
MRIAYFDCFAGISGDMTLGALVDAGADFEALKSELAKLHIHDFELSSERVMKRGIAACDVMVHTHHHHHHDEGHHGHSHGRSFTDIKHIISESKLSDRVKRDSIAIFATLGEAEAKIHGSTIDSIHFHEVGAVDAIVDIVGACICLELLGIEKLYCSPVPTFTGMVEIAHGRFPLPAPATMEILTSKGAPWRELGIEGEIVTPTGAAIVATLAEGFGSMPAMNIQSTSYGAGKQDFGIPNVLRVVVGETEAAADGESEAVDVVVIETNIDDLSPQIYEVVTDKLFDAGALDVYMTPIVMKKSRPATLLSVICEPRLIDALSRIIFEETTSIGLRIDERKRICLQREIRKVQTEYGTIRMKVASRDGKTLNVQPEFEDCRSAATKLGMPVKRIRDAAIVAFYEKGD